MATAEINITHYDKRKYGTYNMTAVAVMEAVENMAIQYHMTPDEHQLIMFKVPKCHIACHVAVITTSN